MVYIYIFVWDREDYLKEAYKQLYELCNREVYKNVPNDPNILINTIMKALEKIRLRGDLSSDALNYFLFKDPKFAGSIFYRKYIKAYMMYQVDQLFQTAAFTLRIYLHFWTTICSILQ